MESRHGERDVLWGLVLVTAGALLLLGSLDIVVFPWHVLTGPVVLGIPGLIFAQVFLGNRDQWWAIIPSGVLLTLASIAFIDGLLPRLDTGWLFFLGLAITFGLVWRETGHAQQWARVVAVICLGFAGLTLFGSLLRFLIPLALLGAGIYLLAGRGRMQ
ncbi:hypothetical protein J2Z79_001456 [Symbiobacterium terraclitae]|uniref:DUF308 domain-containing protein n=1 Tax=Symbiobacterium terraclitae TaxID=557451 RepID=A0ABS4JR95_9FIRM|nr:hypothetical protein [Symbiobacterium terraclitae]MBP2018057.1 hypothetical protein [Symbiobacterium terraclitae]